MSVVKNGKGYKGKKPAQRKRNPQETLSNPPRRM